MANKIHGILRAVAATPWAIQEEKLHAILDLLELRAAGGKLAAEDVARIQAENRAPVARSAGAVAVLPLYGVVAQRMNVMTQFSGGTSTEKFAALFDDAMGRADVSAIVIDVDSPGGAVEGTPELAARIFQARGKKPITAVANSLMASAAYWIASAADEIVVAPAAQVGSIGVFTVHTDYSQADASDGIRHSIISAGKYKTEANSFEPLSAEAKAAIQRMVDDIYGMFVADVAKHRGASTSAVRAGYGEGRVLMGRAAVAAGLADRVGTLEDVIASLGASNGKRSRMAALAKARRNHAGEEAIVDAAARVGLPTTGTSGCYDGTSVALLASAPHNDRYLVVGGEPALASDDMCETCGAALSEDGLCPNEHDQPDDDEIDDGPPADNQSRQSSRTTESRTAAEGAARSDAPPPPQRQAPAPAQEQTVSATTAPQNGATQPIVSFADQIALLDLASANGKTAAEAKKWIEDGKTVTQVQGELLAELRHANQPIASIAVGADRAADRPFKNLGEQLFAIVQAGKVGGRTDARLTRVNFQAGLPAGMNEAVGSEGGFFIQPDLLPGVLEPAYEDDPILSRVQRVPIGANSNSLKMNVVDETARTTGNRWGGIQSAWLGEASTLTSSKPKLRQIELSLKKLAELAYLTDEQLQDAPATESLLTKAFAAETAFMLAAAVFKGTGAGQPLGFLNSGALVSVAIEAGQTIANSAGSISLNLTKMLARVPGSLWDQVIWLYNQDLLPKLVNATIGTGGAAVPAFIAAGGLANRPFDMILGKPAYTSEMCEAEGTPGDIVAVVPSQYILADKGGPQQAQSIHVKFLSDETALRIIYRVDGQPIWRVAVTPFKGANTRSPFVALAART